MRFGLVFVPGYVTCGELVSCQRIMYLMNCFPPSFSSMMRVVVWHCVPAAVVHGLWCRHCDQGVETFSKVAKSSSCGGTMWCKVVGGMTFSSLPLIQMMHAVSSAYQI